MIRHVKHKLLEKKKEKKKMSVLIKDKNWCLPAQVFFTLWSQHSTPMGSGCGLGKRQAFSYELRLGLVGFGYLKLTIDWIPSAVMPYNPAH